MRPRPSNVPLFLLATLWAGGAASVTASPLLPPGIVELTPSPEAIARQACDVLENPGGTLSKCHIRPDLLWNSDLKSGGAGAPADALRFVSTEAIVTPCGTWDARLTLAPSLSLEDPRHGILEIRARLDLTHQATGRTVDYPLVLELGLAGPWVPAAPGERRGTPPRRSEPALGSKGDEEDCIPAWVFEADPELAIELQLEGCEACPDKAAVAPRHD